MNNVQNNMLLIKIKEKKQYLNREILAASTKGTSDCDARPAKPVGGTSRRRIRSTLSTDQPSFAQAATMVK
jgi:hypothetical protein